jgi:DNA-binding GntR family transcriptional regulator
MNSGATTERVYEGLKHRLLGNVIRPGDRLDPAKLAEDLHSSVTPVRDALHLLTGERLVTTRVSDGFHVATVDAPGLQDLYEWNAQVLLLSLSSRQSPRPTPSAEEQRRSTHESAAAALFLGIAAGSRNAEHRLAILSLNDRLSAARLCEARVLPAPEQEADELRTLFDSGDMKALRRGIVAYHRRRRKLANELVRMLYR